MNTISVVQTLFFHKTHKGIYTSYRLPGHRGSVNITNTLFIGGVVPQTIEVTCLVEAGTEVAAPDVAEKAAVKAAAEQAKAEKAQAKATERASKAQAIAEKAQAAAQAALARAAAAQAAVASKNEANVAEEVGA